MPQKNPINCPGISQFMRPVPEFIKCPKCGTDVEIWSDEDRAQCPKCGTNVQRIIQSCLDWCEYADKCRDLIQAGKKERSEL